MKEAMSEEDSDFEIVIRPKDELLAGLFGEAEPVLDFNQKNVEDIIAVVFSQLPNALNYTQAQLLSESYQTVGGIALQVGSDGNYTATLRNKKGEIVEHVPLRKTSSEFATAVKQGFSVNCAIAGQAQMMQVAEQLKEIQSALIETKDRDWREKINAVECAMQGFKEAVAINSDQTARRIMIHISRNQLREALANVYAFMEEQLIRIPTDTSSNGFFDNWSFRKTKSEVAAEYFRYFARLLPVYCRGVTMFTMTDAYVQSDADWTGLAYARRLKELFEKYDVKNRTALVPTILGKDPGKLIIDFLDGVDSAIEKFENFNRKLSVGDLRLAIPINSK